METEFEKITKYIRNLYNRPEGFIPLHEPVFTGNEKKYLNECIDSTFVSSIGNFVDQFEEEVAKYTGAKKAVVCVNGTSALFIGLKMAGVEAGSEVITQSLTFVATANAISYCNAKPVFLDVDKKTLGLSPERLESWLRDNTKYDPRLKKTINVKTNKTVSACVPMHTFGHACAIDDIVEVCNNYNIPVVEDAAESLGTFYKGKHTGTFGIIGALSFNGNKIITTGGGGVLLFQDEVLAKRTKHITNQAKVPHAWEFFHDQVGYNFRMPNINAALGLAQLEKLTAILRSKRRIAESYNSFFFSTKIKFIEEPENSESNFWLNSILCSTKKERDAFLAFSNENGIMTRPVWKLLSKLDMYKNCQTDELINSYWLEDRIVNIPSSAIL